MVAESGGAAAIFMLGEWKQRWWPAFVGLLALALIVLPLSTSAARSVFSAGGIACVHADEMPGAPSLSSGVTQPPCDEHHCAHGPFCCMSSCLAFAGLALPAETLALAPFLDFAVYQMAPSTRPNGFGVAAGFAAAPRDRLTTFSTAKARAFAEFDAHATLDSEDRTCLKLARRLPSWRCLPALPLPTRKRHRKSTRPIIPTLRHPLRGADDRPRRGRHGRGWVWTK